MPSRFSKEFYHRIHTVVSDRIHIETGGSIGLLGQVPLTSFFYYNPLLETVIEWLGFYTTETFASTTAIIEVGTTADNNKFATHTFSSGMTANTFTAIVPTDKVVPKATLVTLTLTLENQNGEGFLIAGIGEPTQPA